MKVTNMKSIRQEDIRGAVPVKVSEEATGKELKYSRSIFCVIKISGFVDQKERTQDMSYQGGFGCLLHGGEPSKF